MIFIKILNLFLYQVNYAGISWQDSQKNMIKNSDMMKKSLKQKLQQRL